MIKREKELKILRQMLKLYPAVGIIGARQVGKTTLARMIANESKMPVTHFDLENPEDLPTRLEEVIKVACERRQSGKAWQKDIEHLRYFYPDGAMRLCLDRLGL